MPLMMNRELSSEDQQSIHHDSLRTVQTCTSISQFPPIEYSVFGVVRRSFILFHCGIGAVHASPRNHL